MKAKNLIDKEDCVDNPSKPVLGGKIPRFNILKNDSYHTERGCMNYGVFLATSLANRKAAPILNALVTYFYEENGKEKEAAFSELKQLAQRYNGSNG